AWLALTGSWSILRILGAFLLLPSSKLSHHRIHTSNQFKQPHLCFKCCVPLPNYNFGVTMAILTTLVVAAPCAVVIAYTLNACLRYWRNYSDARSIGVPIRFIPISPLNPFWMLLERKMLPLAERFFGESSFTRYNWRGWEVKDRYRSHQEMGDI